MERNPASYPHDWLDNNGANPWDKWTVYVQEKNSSVWQATLHIANTKNGEKILYDIGPIKMVEQRGKSRTSTTTDNDTTKNEEVNPKFSSKLDTDYLAAVERGDMDAVQNMADEAAKSPRRTTPRRF